MSSRPYFKFFLRPFFSSKSKLDWKRLACDSQERVIKVERKLRETEQMYFKEAKLRFEDKIVALQCDLLRLRYNFNLRGALEYSLEAYGDCIKAPQASKTVLLDRLTKDPVYTKCLQNVSQRFQRREADINMCAQVLYHKLSKHAHGNTAELVVNDNEHPITEVAAIEAVFGALKTKGCFQIPMRIVVQNHEHTL